MGNHYGIRKDLSKYTLKSFDGVNEFAFDTNASDLLTYNANGTTKVVVDTTSAQQLAGKVFPTTGGEGAGPTAITAAQSGTLFLLDRAAGKEYTLPAPSAGLWYDFVVTVSVTSNDYEITGNTPGTDLYIGSLWETVAAGTGTSFFPNGSTNSAIVMNGTTSGGLINTFISIICINGTTWLVDGTNFASGTIVTPFANS